MKNFEERENGKNGMIFLSAIILAFALVVIGHMGFASATATDSNPQLSLFSTQPSNAAFNNSICTKSQDFAVQISPLGCQPTIVRSDLLSQQNVQVYCPLAATQLNPLINVNSISGISFAGNYSKYVSSIGFYPAQAALSTGSQTANSPVLNNIGYVVIDLKQQPNESSMPDYVTGNLTASLSYDATNAFGLGNTNFYLSQLSDSQWQQQYQTYSFLNGKGYLKLDNLYNGQATISVYNSNLNKISTVTLKQGESSQDLSIPGFDFCSATMKITLNSLSNPGTLAKLEVNGNVLEAANGQRFLGNDCQVQGISSAGLTNDVQISCSTDSGTQTFDLKNSPQVVINVNGKNQTAGLGDFLYQNGNDYVYLGYIGSTASLSVDSSNPEKMMLIFVSLPNHDESQLSSDELSSIASLVQQVTPTKISDVGVANAVTNVLKTPLGITNLFLRNLVQGTKIKKLDFGDKSVSIFGNQVKIEGFAGPQNSVLQNTAATTYYKNAVTDYQSISNAYASESYPSGSSPSLGERALYQQMELALTLNQKNDLAALCSDFEKDYPNAKEDIKFCSNLAVLSSSSISSQNVLINGQVYQISLDDVTVPSFQDYGAMISVQSPGGKTTSYPMIKDESITLDSTAGDFVQLDSISGDTATITTKPGNAFQSSSHVLNKDVKTKIGDYNFTLTGVNLAQMAQVSVTPKSNDVGSQANFSFKIGIEKSLIQLSPDKIKEQIAATNKSIAEWEKISGATSTVLNVTKNLCALTSVVLTAANFISNLEGTGLAREKVMEGTGGWNDKCKEMVSQGQYKSLDDCFIKNAKQINEDVNQTAYWMNQQNSQISQLQKLYTTKPAGLSGVLSSGVVNTDEFMKSYSTNVQSSLNCLGSQDVKNPLSSNAPPISMSDAKTLMTYGSYSDNNYNVGQAKNVQLYSEIICSSSSSSSLKSWAQQQLYSTLSDVQTNAGNYAARSKAASSLGEGTSPSDFAFLNVQQGTVAKDWTGKTVSDYSQLSGLIGKTVDLPGRKLTISSNTAVQPLQTSLGGEYLLLLDNSLGTSKYPIVGVYNLDGTAVAAKDVPSAVSNALQKVYFQKVDASAYQNAYKSPEVQYFETAPYTGVPAIVPFDLKNGWYAAIKQTSPVIGSSLGSSGTSVDASGRVESFWLCNVGSNGIEEFDATMNAGSSGSYDDCQSINLNTQSTYTQFSGLSQSETTKLVGEALSAIKQAQQQYKSGVSSVIINGQNIKVGTPATDNPSIQCEDFMSPTSCDILFNVCDPVVCPSSRCNFGGAFPVKDVVQTGVIGSTLLCLPNWVPFGGTDYVPVCLPGIQGGIDSFISVQKSYEQCLQNNLATGQTTGICGEIYDLYGCNLFWQNAVPFAKLGLSKIVQAATGQGTQGGAEYLNVQNALTNAQNSMSYITNSYAANSLEAFQTQSTQGVGVGVCKNFIQTVFPSESNLVNTLSAADSPPQYMGSFSETPFTTATVPPTSQYQVYYHIYAGKNAGAYYSVYLENSGGSYYQDTSAQYVVDSGYISAGDSADQTKDFTAPSGYTQMCINVNGNTQCGFKEVSTSLAVNAIKDSYVSAQANQTNITTESQCRYGTINVLGANINIQSAPSLGITRVCATGNPGNSTDPNAGTAESRWVEVGYCGNKNLGCWLDTQSVTNAINSPDIIKFLTNGTTTTLQNSTLQSLQNSYATVLQNSGKYLTDSQFNSELKQISFENDPSAVVSIIDGILGKVLYNNQKAELLLLRGEAYGLLALGSVSSEQAAKQTASGSAATGGAGAGTQVCGGYSTYDECMSAYGSSVDSSLCNTCSTSPANSGETSGPSGGSAQPTGATSSAVTPSVILQIMESANKGNTQTYKGTLGGKECDCGTASQCQDYANSLYSSAKANGEDPLLLLSIMMQESQCEVNAVGGTSQGLMQIDSSTVSECYQSNGGISGVSGISDVTGAANYDKNIQCGALILKKKNDAYGAGTGSHAFPAQGFAPCSDGFTATYTGWNASIRGYNGYGCPQGTDEHYVDKVDVIYHAILNLLAQMNINLVPVTSQQSAEQVAHQTQGQVNTIVAKSCTDAGYLNYNDCLTQQTNIQGAGTATIYCQQICPNTIPSSVSGGSMQKPSVNSYGLTSYEVSNYTQYRSSFDTYAKDYLPNPISTALSKEDFEAILVAIADENNWSMPNGDWLMGYQVGNSQFQGSDNQVLYVANLLQKAINGQGAGLNYQTGSNVDYSQCNSQASSGFEAQVKCILSIYHTGKINTNGFLGIGLGFLGANTEGENYANAVLDKYHLWSNYLTDLSTSS